MIAISDRRIFIAPLSSALIAVMVGFGSTIALIIQAHASLGATESQISSTITSICIGIGITGAMLSCVLKVPVILGWSTPGAALLATGITVTTYTYAIGAFVSAGLLTVLIGLMPWLDRIAIRIPLSIGSGMLAGVILPYSLTLIGVAQTHTLFVAMVVSVYLVARQFATREALILTIIVAISATLYGSEVASTYKGNFHGILIYTEPNLDLMAFLSLGIPLFLITLASQNVPGLLVLRAAGFSVSSKIIFTSTGIVTALLAPFGVHGINLAAMTAALCTSPEAHPDQSRRWIAGLIFGILYVALAIFSGAVVKLFLAIPKETTAVITGIAVIPPLIGSLKNMLFVPEENDAAILTFLATASGISIMNIGSAFWGLVIGFFSIVVKQLFSRKLEN